jgi:hypothetical protein
MVSPSGRSSRAIRGEGAGAGSAYYRPLHRKGGTHLSANHTRAVLSEVTVQENVGAFAPNGGV